MKNYVYLFEPKILFHIKFKGCKIPTLHILLFVFLKILYMFLNVIYIFNVLSVFMCSLLLLAFVIFESGVLYIYNIQQTFFLYELEWVFFMLQIQK